jgi:glycosyltransferase involved in cell wall biosynthesis
LFDTLEAVALLRAKLARANSPMRVHLVVAGKFPQAREQMEFEERIAKPDLNGPSSPGKQERVVDYRGFVAGADKDRLMRESDCLCFPTYYPIEGHPVTVVEALAYGLEVVTTRWRAMPEFFDPDYGGLVEPRAPEQLAIALEQSMRKDPSARLREIFLEKFTLERFAGRMREVLTSAD